MRRCPPANPRPALLMWALLLLLTKPVHGASDEDTRLQALAHYQAGEAALTSERFADAVEEFHQAITLDPLLVMAHYGLGQAHMALKEYAEAVRAYSDCRKAFHEDLASQNQSESDRQRRLDDQIRALEDQIAIQRSGRPTPGPVRPLSAANVTTLERQLDTLRSRRSRSSLTTEKTPPWISVALGSAYFRNDALADAEREYKAALDADPKVGEAHNNLAVVYLLTNRVADAEREVALAERTGFKVREGLKRDIARQKVSKPAP